MTPTPRRKPTITVSTDAIGYIVVFQRVTETGDSCPHHSPIYRTRAEADAAAAPPYLHPRTVSAEVRTCRTAFVDEVPAPYTLRQMQRWGYPL